MLETAQVQPEFLINFDQFDADPHLLNGFNRTLDLRTGVLHPHMREQYLSKIAPVSYRPDAPAPLREQLLATTFKGSDDMIAAIQRAVGYPCGLRSPSFFLLVNVPPLFGS